MTAPIRYPHDTPPPEGETLEIAPGIHWIRLPLPMKLDHVNCYALDDGNSWTIVDTGFSSRKGRAIWDRLLAGPLAGKPVSRVIATHHHPDHVGLAGWFIARGAELLMPRTPWLLTRMLTLDEQPTYSPESIRFYTRAGMDADVLTTRLTERPFNFADCVHPLPLGFTRLTEGQSITMAGRPWTVRMGDGHAPEHATFWTDDIVLGGDQLLPSISANLGVYPTEPEADPVADWLAACDRLAPFATDTQLILPGHKLPFTGLPKRMQQYTENHHSALDRLRAHLTTPHSAAQCFLPLFKRDISGGEYGLALVEAMAHVNHLWLAGEASRTLSSDGAYMFQML